MRSTALLLTWQFQHHLFGPPEEADEITDRGSTYSSEWGPVAITPPTSFANDCSYMSRNKVLQSCSLFLLHGRFEQGTLALKASQSFSYREMTERVIILVAWSAA